MYSRNGYLDLNYYIRGRGKEDCSSCLKDESLAPIKYLLLSLGKSVACIATCNSSESTVNQYTLMEQSP